MKLLLCTFLLLAGVSTAMANDELVRQELAPTGKLRIAIAISPAPSALYAVKDQASGQFKGVSVTLGAKLAEKLGVSYEYVPYLASGEIQNAASTGVWDVTFMPVDDERKKFVDFGTPYHLLQSTYLIAHEGAIKSVQDANRAGVRIAGVANTATFRASLKASPNATHVTVGSVNEAVELIKAGKADGVALSRESLLGLLPQLPGAYVLEDGFLNSTTAIAVPKNKPEALAYVSAFIEEAKASGLVRRAFDDMGLRNAKVAPPGIKP